MKKYGAEIKNIEENNKSDYKKVKNLLKTLKEELNSFSYNGDYRGLSHFIDKIIILRPKLSSTSQKNINNEIIELHSLVKKIINTRSRAVSNDNPNFKELRRIISNLEGLDLSYRYSYMEEYDGNTYNLLRYLLFAEKNLSFVQYILTFYPHFINAGDENESSIVFDVVKSYLKAIDDYVKDGTLNYSDDLFFFDQVLESLFLSSKIKYSERLKKNVLQEVNNFLDRVDFSKMNYQVKSKFIFWVNELKNKLEGKEVDETLEHLSYKTDIVTNFNEAVMSEVRNFDHQKIKLEIKNRDKIKDEYIITIDGDRASEIDDGLSVNKMENGNYLLGVHIADPTGYVKNNSLIYDTARNRTTSIYLPSGETILMFPDIYAKDYMSLMEKRFRFGTSYYLEITPDGEIILDNVHFKKTFLIVSKKLTYDKFNELIEQGSDERRLDETIGLLQEVSNAISKRDKTDIAYRMVSRSESNASGTNIIGSSSGERIVENAMLATNTTVANYMAKHNLPFIYRGHNISKTYLDKINYFEHKIKENPSNENYDALVKYLKETYPKAFYTTDSSIGHNGLGLEHYSHLTSPLRRFADCLATEALNMFYFSEVEDEKEIAKFIDRLNSSCKYINEKDTAITYFQENYSKVKKKELTNK